MAWVQAAMAAASATTSSSLRIGPCRPQIGGPRRRCGGGDVRRTPKLWHREPEGIGGTGRDYVAYSTFFKPKDGRIVLGWPANQKIYCKTRRSTLSPVDDEIL
jgi:hypothetical protein